MVPFTDELRHIKAYLNIEKIRFGDRLNVETEIGTSTFCVPPLSIQPIVENAVKHGICKKVNGGTVKIRSFEKESGYIIVVEDDGAGFDMAELEAKSHIGIQSIRLRVGTIAGGNLELQSEPGAGTNVDVFLATTGQAIHEKR